MMGGFFREKALLVPAKQKSFAALLICYGKSQKETSPQDRTAQTQEAFALQPPQKADLGLSPQWAPKPFQPRETYPRGFFLPQRSRLVGCGKRFSGCDQLG
jgi:hypothetical protein